MKTSACYKSSFVFLCTCDNADGIDCEQIVMTITLDACLCGSEYTHLLWEEVEESTSARPFYCPVFTKKETFNKYSPFKNISQTELTEFINSKYPKL